MRCKGRNYKAHIKDESPERFWSKNIYQTFIFPFFWVGGVGGSFNRHKNQKTKYGIFPTAPPSHIKLGP